MASLATPEDVEAVWRPLTDAELAAATAWLGYASALVRSRVPTVDDRITAGTLDADLAKFVVVAMVRRVMQRPDAIGVRQESETLGSWSHSATYDDAVASGELCLTDEELALLRPLRSGAFSITPGIPPSCTPYPLVPRL